MKRDMNLIRDILLRIADAPAGYYAIRLTGKDFGIDQAMFYEHCRLVTEHNLAEASFLDNGTVNFRRLTWEGHDFIGNARDPNIWQRTIKTAGDLSFSVLIRVLEEVALKVAMGGI